MGGIFVNLNCLFGYGTFVYALKLQLLVSNDLTCLVRFGYQSWELAVLVPLDTCSNAHRQYLEMMEVWSVLKENCLEQIPTISGDEDMAQCCRFWWL